MRITSPLSYRPTHPRCWAAAMLACVLAGPPVAGAVDWDWEPRCCVVERDIERDLAEGMLITLTAVGPPIGHLQALTPGGVRIGMDDKTHYFYPPQDWGEGGLYALVPPERAIDAPGYLDDQPRVLIVYPFWNSEREGRIYRTFMPQLHRLPPDRSQWRLLPGRYQVKVIGEFTGRYVLRFDLDGRGGPRPELVVAGADGRGVPIQAGEIQVYEFNGGMAIYGDPREAQSLTVRRIK